MNQKKNEPQLGVQEQKNQQEDELLLQSQQAPPGFILERTIFKLCQINYRVVNECNLLWFGEHLKLKKKEEFITFKVLAEPEGYL